MLEALNYLRKAVPPAKPWKAEPLFGEDVSGRDAGLQQVIGEKSLRQIMS